MGGRGLGECLAAADCAVLAAGRHYPKVYFAIPSETRFTPLRLVGAAIFLVACVLALRTVQPDVYVSPSGDSFAVRGPDGQLQVIRLGNDAFAIREWLAADGDARGDPRAVAATVKAREGFACDAAGWWRSARRRRRPPTTARGPRWCSPRAWRRRPAARR